MNSKDADTAKKTKRDVLMERLEKWRHEKKTDKTVPLKEISNKPGIPTKNKISLRRAGEIKAGQVLVKKPKDEKNDKRTTGTRQHLQPRQKAAVNLKPTDSVDDMRKRLEEWKRKKEEEKKERNCPVPKKRKLQPECSSAPLPRPPASRSRPPNRPELTQKLSRPPKVGPITSKVSHPSKNSCTPAPPTKRNSTASKDLQMKNCPSAGNVQTSQYIGALPRQKPLKHSVSAVTNRRVGTEVPSGKLSRATSSMSNVQARRVSPRSIRENSRPQAFRRRSFIVMTHHSSTASHKVAPMPNRRSSVAGTLKKSSASTSALKQAPTQKLGLMNKRHSMSSHVGVSKHLATVPAKSILKTPHKGAVQAAITEVSERDSSTESPSLEHLATGVRFTIPSTTPNTGGKRRTMAATSQSAELSRREKLNEWLLSHGKTPTRYRHLCCFDEAVSAKKKRLSYSKSGLSTSELSAQQSKLKEEVQVKSVRPTPVRESEQKEELKVLLKECNDLFEAGCPPESIRGWLDEISHNFEETLSTAAYWICRSRLAEETGNDHEALDIFEEGCRNNAQPPEDMAEALKHFVTRMVERAHAVKMAAHTPRRAPEVQAENAFTSSAVKYCLTRTTPFFKRLHTQAAGSGSQVSVVTPVRRSTRRSTANLPSMLQDHDVIIENLEEIPVENRRSTLYVPNDALISDESDSELDPTVQNTEAALPVRSLEAEFDDVADA